MTVMGKLLAVETKLVTRDWGIVGFGLVFPALLLTVLGYAFPGFQDPNPDLGGGRLIDLYTPIILVFVFVMVGVSSMSSYLATYRHEGILRRLRTTPVGPHRMVVASVGAHLAIALLGALAAIVVALALFDVPAPASWSGAVAGLVLTAAAMFSIGALIGSVASSTSASQVISGVVWLPLMLLAGLWFPREGMPDTMRRISDLSPGGAGVDAVQQAWFGAGAPAGSLAVLAVFTLGAMTVAIMTFRWD